MKQVNLRTLAEIAHRSHPGLDGCAVQISFEGADYLFRTVKEALGCLVHFAEIEEVRLYGDEGENNEEIEPYIHFVDLSELAPEISLLVEDEKLTIKFIPFHNPTDLLI